MMQQPSQPVDKNDKSGKTMQKPPQTFVKKEKNQDVPPFFSLLKSPWFLLTIPVLVGGLWLIQHLSVITDNLNKPYALLAGPALVASVLGAWLLVTFFKSIVAGISYVFRAFQEWKKGDGSTFWIVIAIFLLVSVTESGTYFNELLGSFDIYGTLGYATAFVVDIVAVECMRARLRAARMHDRVGKNLYLLGIVACAALSAYANTYTALSHFHAPTHTLLPVWMVTVAPWTGMAFPLLIIFLSFTADYTADQTSSKLNPEAYKKADDDRQKLLEYQYESLKNRREFEQKIDALNGKQRTQRVFFLLNWFFPEKHNLKEVIGQIKELQSREKPITQDALKTLIEAALQPEITALSTRIHGQETSAMELQKVVESVSQNVGSIASLLSQLQAVQETLMEEIAREKEAALVGGNQSESTLLSDEEEEENEDDKGQGKGQKSGVDWRDDPELETLAITYPIVKVWQAGSANTISLQGIIEGTKHTPQMIHQKEKANTFTRTKRAGSYRIESVIKWLKVAPLPRVNGTKKEGKNTAYKARITDSLEAVNVAGIDQGKGLVSEQETETNGHEKEAKNVEEWAVLSV